MPFDDVRYDGIFCNALTFPNIVIAWNDPGELYLMKNDKTEARKCFGQAMKLRPGNPRASENLKKLIP